jgi:hypothetical protein
MNIYFLQNLMGHTDLQVLNRYLKQTGCKRSSSAGGTSRQLTMITKLNSISQSFFTKFPSLARNYGVGSKTFSFSGSAGKTRVTN